MDCRDACRLANFLGCQFLFKSLLFNGLECFGCFFHRRQNRTFAAAVKWEKKKQSKKKAKINLAIGKDSGESMWVMQNKTISTGNNETLSRGVFQNSDGTWTALTYANSKTFKTQAGANRWFAKMAA